VAQDFEEKRRKYECQNLRAEAEKIAEITRRLERHGIDPLRYEVPAAEVYRLTDDKAPFVVVTEKQKVPVHSLRDVLTTVKDFGKKGISIQRYKGLGEMNPHQLWETTMDPSKRTLIRVSLDMAGDYEAEETFSTLMGDDVDKRRQFIQRHAPEVRNLDV
jgi:DNA gyrase subunit B